MNLSEDVESKVIADLYNKKVIIHGVEGTTVKFKCATINEFVELIDKCKKLLKTDNLIIR
jgi:hypothetical protein